MQHRAALCGRLAQQAPPLGEALADNRGAVAEYLDGDEARRLLR